MNERSTHSARGSQELDAEVSHAVYGQEVYPCNDGTGDWLIRGQDGEDSIISPFSTSIGSAWEVVEAMLECPDQRVYLAFVRLWGEAGFVAPAHIAAPRICRSALAAIRAGQAAE